ncbi:BglG family transcription antiterminator [Cetobacterium somerae]
MTLSINTKHLRLFKLLEFTKGDNLEFCELFLNINRANLYSYLKEIQKVVPQKQNITKTDEIITSILNQNICYSFLKKEQNISKDDRIFFLTLHLLLKSSLNLQSLSNILGVSRRTLNVDLITIKKNIEIYSLDIHSISGKGVFLEGDFVNIKRALCTYIYKYLVEENYLPNIFKQSFSHIFHNQEIDSILQKQIEHFISIANCDSFFYNRELLKSFYISFKFLDDDTSYENQIKNNLNTLDKFKIYFENIFKSNSLKEIFNFFQVSILGEISFEDIHFLINILKISKGLFPEENIFIKNHFSIFKNIFKNNLNLDLKRDLFIDRFLSRTSFCSKQKHYLSIFEMSFLNLNLDDLTIKKCIILFKELRKIYWNISFTDVVSLYLYTNSINKKEEKKLVIVYNTIPKYLLEQLKDKIELDNNITITNFININLFNDFIKINNIKCVGIFEGALKNSLGNLEVEYLTFPV